MNHGDANSNFWKKSEWRNLLSLVPLFVLWPGCCALIVALPACRGKQNPTPVAYERAEVIGIQIPRPTGWHRVKEMRIIDAAKGGTELRLETDDPQLGSPRIDIIMQPLTPRPMRLQAFLQQELASMSAQERDGQMHITAVDQKPVRIGPRHAIEVRHEYTLQAGKKPWTFTQWSVFLLLDGRGVTVTALGRSELFRPLAHSVESILSGIQVIAKSDNKNNPIDLDRVDWQ